MTSTQVEGVSPENSRGGDAGKRPAGASSQPEWWESGTRRQGSRLRSGREPSAPLHGELPLGSNPQPRSGEPASGARGNTSFACVLTSKAEGRQSSVRGRTWISFVIGLVAPKRHDLVSLAPPSSMPHLG